MLPPSTPTFPPAPPPRRMTLPPEPPSTFDPVPALSSMFPPKSFGPLVCPAVSEIAPPLPDPDAPMPRSSDPARPSPVAEPEFIEIEPVVPESVIPVSMVISPVLAEPSSPTLLAVYTETSPVLDLRELPLVSEIDPPSAVGSSVRPALKVISPPLPEAPTPTATFTEPLEAVSEFPVERRIIPAALSAECPVSSTIAPVTPAPGAESPVCKTSPPLALPLLAPLFK
mmetsp:Transcript_6414/g.11039  ORF Transcript_6414/g.11039 Transcript_6414/m.11039 type:complete len:227 (+) Transcript_6414:21638-22318(+)